jgi:hypothetical protein
MTTWKFPTSNEFKHKYTKKISQIAQETAGIPMANLAINTWETLDQCLSGRTVGDFSMIARFAVIAHVNAVRKTECEKIVRDTEMFTEKLVEIVINVLSKIAIVSK